MFDQHLTEQGYIRCSERLPDRGVVVDTLVFDGRGLRNEQRLQLINRLWFFEDGSMYVYYDPTHWKPIVPTLTDAERQKLDRLHEEVTRLRAEQGPIEEYTGPGS